MKKGVGNNAVQKRNRKLELGYVLTLLNTYTVQNIHICIRLSSTSVDLPQSDTTGIHEYN